MLQKLATMSWMLTRQLCGEVYSPWKASSHNRTAFQLQFVGRLTDSTNSPCDKFTAQWCVPLKEVSHQFGFHRKGIPFEAWLCGAPRHSQSVVCRNMTFSSPKNKLIRLAFGQRRFELNPKPCTAHAHEHTKPNAKHLDNGRILHN